MMYIHLYGMCIMLLISIVMCFGNIFINDDISTIITSITMILTVVLVIFFFIGECKCSKAEWQYSDEPYSTQRIVSLNDNNLTQGRIYMRRGYIEDDLYYQYMMRVSGGGFKANKVKASTATLYYSDGDYRVEWYKKTRNWLYFEEEGYYQKIYIPEGSITDEYSVDLE